MTGGRGLREAPPGRARGALREADPRLGRGQHRLGVGTGPKKGSELTGPNSTDHANPGSKYYLLTDRNGLPLHVLAPAANTHDSRLFDPRWGPTPVCAVSSDTLCGHGAAR